MMAGEVLAGDVAGEGMAGGVVAIWLQCPREVAGGRPAVHRQRLAPPTFPTVAPPRAVPPAPWPAPPAHQRCQMPARAPAPEWVALLNTSLIVISGVFLLIGYYFIRQRNVELH